MIYIDTDAIRVMMSQMENACEQIDRALVKINSAQSHRDWNCRERANIINMMDNNKKNMSKIQQNANSLSRNIRAVSTLFDDTEKEVKGLMDVVDNTITDIVNIVKPYADIYTDNSIWSQISLSDINPLVYTIVGQPPTPFSQLQEFTANLTVDDLKKVVR